MGSNLMSNYDWINDVGGSDAEISWALDGFNGLPNAGMRDESCTGHMSKASREKVRRDRLNDRLMELVEKNELKNDKINLKAEKEMLEEQVKAMSVPPVGFMPHPAAFHAAAAAAFSAQGQTASNKTAAPFPGFPGAAMWQWMPPAVVDTSQNLKLRPPVA
ncbi:hypothetical protein NE237_021595 [Protea cynaroides]|uniref:BHLH domain-containing protein n=1 Tax=Protea cynaroides TaxID=273540 RepID=A0A9Q0K4H8_9MAGN|nr:hypothetical protein NE237_021595 [Protea cynaroides]